MVALSLIICPAMIPLIGYAIWKKQFDTVLPAYVILFFLTLIPLLIGLNTPNMDWIYYYPITTR